jgi:hypothetical protein
LEGKKPNAKIRQGLNTLMGIPLSADMTPQAIQAAQAVFKSQGKPQQSTPPSGKTQGSSSKLSKSDQSFLTGPQSLVARSQRKT